MKTATGFLTVGALAKAAGVGVPTLRYYERRGLLAPPRRRASGYRDYDADSLRRLRFIRQAQALGFSLREVAELLALDADPGSGCADVRARAQARLDDLETRIASLQRLRGALRTLVAACPADAPAERCPILEVLHDAPAR